MIVPPIDAGEELLARTGIGHVLNRSTTPLWLRKTHDRYEDQIRSKMSAFVSTKTHYVKVKPPAFDYDKELERLTSQKTLEPNTAATERLDADTLAAYCVAINRVLGYLSSELPKSTITDMVSTRNVKPSDLTIAGFRRLFAVAEDPLVALQAMVDGILTRDQVVALKTMFPSIYEAAKVILAQEIQERTVGHPEWHLPYSRDQLVMVFMEVPAGDAAALATLQKNFANAKERAAIQQKDAPDPAPPGRGLAKSVETPVQRASQ